MRSKAQQRAEKRIQSLTYRVAVRFRVDREEDADTLEWLRSQVANDSEIPALIRRIVEERRQN